MKSRRSSNSIINAWCLYDAGNSAFATTIMAAILPVYFREVAAAGLPAGLPPALWGYTSSLSLLLGAALAPILGSIADVCGSRKKFLSGFTLLGAISTAMLFFTGKGDWTAVLFLYALGSLGFSLSMIFYDALLPHIALPGQINMISSKGYAWGYIGGGTLLAVNLVAITVLPGTLGTRISFISVALWWSVFSIPLLLFVPEPPSEMPLPKGPKETLTRGFSRLAGTFRKMKNYRDMIIFLAAYWLYNDGVGTIMKMAAIFGSAKGIGMIHLVGALLLTQFVGAPFAILFGRLSMRLGGKRTITVGLIWYTVISFGAFFLEKAWHFWVLAVAVGMVQGGVQAISRSTFGRMVPKAQTGEFFAFYDVFSKFSGVAGPALFAFLTQVSGSSRFGIVSLVVFFLGGIYLLRKVDVDAGVRAANNIDPGANPLTRVPEIG